MVTMVKHGNVMISSVLFSRDCINQVFTSLVSTWKDYKRDQYKLRRMYVNSPDAHHIPWRVWKAHAAMLNEIKDKH